MIYGLYLSATGVVTSAYRQDVISNNLANSETVGFKRDLASFEQRPVADQENPKGIGLSNAMLDKIGGGVLSRPSSSDMSQGILEPTGNNLDVAISGPGFFTVADKDGQQRLTRDGRFRLDRNGKLVMGSTYPNAVLNSQGNEIVLDPNQAVTIDSRGQIFQGQDVKATLDVVDVADPSKLKKDGGSLLSYPQSAQTTEFNGQVEDGYVEHSNVDPAVELADLMDTQRQLEANANMIRYQDQTLGELVNTVGKVS